VDFGVVMVTYNSASLLPHSICPLSSKYYVHVVDNASKDGSAEIAQALGAAVTKLSRNMGFGSAANVGVAELPESVEAMVFINPDVVIEPDVLGKLVSVLDTQPSVGIVAPTLRFPDGGAQLSARGFPSLRALVKRWHKNFDVSGGPTDPRPDWVIGAAFAVRRRDFLSVGGFDPRFFLYGEDVDLCWRMRGQALSIFLSSTVVAQHAYERASASKLRISDPAVRHHWRSIARLALRYPKDFFT
jgi:N-acetylglucosaminyl-diphospho-decaprenol L-rhamnosyltransferase